MRKTATITEIREKLHKNWSVLKWRKEWEWRINYQRFVIKVDYHVLKLAENTTGHQMLIKILIIPILAKTYWTTIFKAHAIELVSIILLILTIILWDDIISIYRQRPKHRELVICWRSHSCYLQRCITFVLWLSDSNIRTLRHQAKPPPNTCINQFKQRVMYFI